MKETCYLILITAAATLSFLPGARAQTNSWTKATSGQWHEPYWSLGLLPDNTQSHIVLTNSGWKSVAIDATTARDFPASLSISNLQVTSPADSLNTLILDYAGLDSPLRVERDFYLGSNALLVALGSGLRVGNQFIVDATTYQDALSDVTTKTLGLGVQGRASYNFGSGTLNADELIVGFWRPWEPSAPPATFTQDGGTSRLGRIEIHSGEYTVRAGDSFGAHLTIGDAGRGLVRQLSGRFLISSNVTLGTGDARTHRSGIGQLELSGGTFVTPRLQLGTHTGYSTHAGGYGFVVQSGGSNIADGLVVGTWDSFSRNKCGYTLTGGTLATTNTIVHTDSDFGQMGGLHVVDGPLWIRGAVPRYSVRKASYSLTEGIVRSHSLKIEVANFSQSGGTNEVDGDLTLVEDPFLGSSVYILNSGELNTSNTFVFASPYGGFTQNGGTHSVAKILDIAGPLPSFEVRPLFYRHTAGQLIAEEIRLRSDGTFTQSGGWVNSRNISIVQGQYSLSGGESVAGGLSVGYGNVGAFEQTGGRLLVTNGLSLGVVDQRYSNVQHGEFNLADGIVSTPRIHIGSFTLNGSKATGRFVQSGGSNLVTTLHVGTALATSFPASSYLLHDGMLASSNTFLNPRGSFAQMGGVHLVDGPLTIAGTLNRYSGESADYDLSNGIVRCQSLKIGPVAGFRQYDGTNEIAGDLAVGEDMFLGGSGYTLRGGLLNTQNTTVQGSLHDDILQSGGTHLIAGTLVLQRPITYYSDQNPVAVRYALEGGELRVRDIRVSTNAVFRHSGGTLSHSGTLTLEGGTWQAAPGAQQLGGVKLGAPNIDSSLLLTDSATTSHFASSAALPWHPAAAFVIKNWRGSTNGNGSHRVVFGTDETGLTSQQLAQIRFRDPVGLPTGDYSATILVTGEIVPLVPTGRNPSIVYQQTSGQLQLVWPVDYTLQTSTNVAGPFEDMKTTSPMTYGTTVDPQRFFRLRR